MPVTGVIGADTDNHVKGHWSWPKLNQVPVDNAFSEFISLVAAFLAGSNTVGAWRQ